MEHEEIMFSEFEEELDRGEEASYVQASITIDELNELRISLQEASKQLETAKKLISRVNFSLYELLGVENADYFVKRLETRSSQLAEECRGRIMECADT